MKRYREGPEKGRRWPVALGLILGLTLANGLAFASTLIMRFEVPGTRGPGSAPGGEATPAQATPGTVAYRLATSNGQGIAVTDGTDAGTYVVVDSADIGMPYFTCCIALGDGTFLFSAYNILPRAASVYVSDGTPGNATELLSSTTSSSMTGVQLSGGRAIFGWDDGTNGAQLWITDGATASIVTDLGDGSMSPTDFTGFK